MSALLGGGGAASGQCPRSEARGFAPSLAQHAESVTVWQSPYGRARLYSAVWQSPSRDGLQTRLLGERSLTIPLLEEHESSQV